MNRNTLGSNEEITIYIYIALYVKFVLIFYKNI